MDTGCGGEAPSTQQSRGYRTQRLTQDPLDDGQGHGWEAHPGVEGVEVGDGRLSIGVAVKHGLQAQAGHHSRQAQHW